MMDLQDRLSCHSALLGMNILLAVSIFKGQFGESIGYLDKIFAMD
jgi:hypothetical protein